MHHSAKYPYTATPPTTCKSRLFDALLAVAAVPGNAAVGPPALRSAAAAAAAAAAIDSGNGGDAAGKQNRHQQQADQPTTKKQKKETKKLSKKQKKRERQRQQKEKQQQQVGECLSWPPARMAVAQHEKRPTAHKLTYGQAKELALEYRAAKAAAQQHAGRWCRRSRSSDAFS